VPLTEQLRHAAKLTTVGRLAAGLAHELGTPLNVVSGRARMIASGRLSPEAIVEGATIIDGQAARMTRIIRQLLDFARRGPPKKATVDPAELARHAVLLLAPLAKKRDVTLRLDLGEDADATAGKVVGDGAQLEQVIANLVVNAIDASKEGGEVVLSLAEEELTPPPAHGGPRGRYLRLDVRDRGVGISPEDQDRVFEPFFTTKDVGAGTGLGLSVVHGIVHEHGGWVAVESQVGEGARFSVYLPRAPSETSRGGLSCTSRNSPRRCSIRSACSTA
jgi:signal transduction histidine kinase